MIFVKKGSSRINVVIDSVKKAIDELCLGADEIDEQIDTNVDLIVKHRDKINDIEVENTCLSAQQSVAFTLANNLKELLEG